MPLNKKLGVYIVNFYTVQKLVLTPQIITRFELLPRLGF